MIPFAYVLKALPGDRNGFPQDYVTLTVAPSLWLLRDWSLPHILDFNLKDFDVYGYLPSGMEVVIPFQVWYLNHDWNPAMPEHYNEAHYNQHTGLSIHKGHLPGLVQGSLEGHNKYYYQWLLKLRPNKS